MASVIRGSDDFDTTLPFVTEQGSNASGHYRKWSNGFIEQWGNVATFIAGAEGVTLPVPFETVFISVVVNFTSAFSAGEFPSIHAIRIGLTSFNAYKYYRGNGSSTTSNANQNFSYYAIGY